VPQDWFSVRPHCLAPYRARRADQNLRSENTQGAEAVRRFVNQGSLRAGVSAFACTVSEQDRRRLATAPALSIHAGEYPGRDPVLILMHNLHLRDLLIWDL
jgi:hypothetical protein